MWVVNNKGVLLLKLTKLAAESFGSISSFSGLVESGVSGAFRCTHRRIKTTNLRIKSTALAME